MKRRFGLFPYSNTPIRYILAESTPTPTTEPIKIKMDAVISYHGTVLMAILVNIAMGEVNGMNEQIFITALSITPKPKVG